jgi:RNA polymerase sigma-70 factor (ECF subfamily)
MEVHMDTQTTQTETATWSRPGLPGAEPDADGHLDPDDVLAQAYEQHRAGLLGYILVCAHDLDAAEDVCQEAFVRLHLALSQGRGPDDPAAWLRRVARNLVISRARRTQVALRHAPRLHEPVGFDPTGSVVIERERVDLIRVALGRIPEEQRQLLLLAAGGFTRAQMGDRLGASPGAIRTRLHRARRQLLGEMDGYDAAT